MLLSLSLKHLNSLTELLSLRLLGLHLLLHLFSLGLDLVHDHEFILVFRNGIIALGYLDLHLVILSVHLINGLLHFIHGFLHFLFL